MKNRLASVTRSCSQLPLRHAHRPLAASLLPASAKPSQRRHVATFEQGPSQRPNSDYVSFPGAVKSAFCHSMKFESPQNYPALPTYRVVDQHGVVVDPDFQADLSDAEVIQLYLHMLTISIMDIIMYEAQRQGRLSFYIVSAGEEAVSVGSSSVLSKDDVIFTQYREQGVFAQRGFTLSDFMNQLFANRHDPGKGRNMPVHYGSRELHIVSRCCWVMPYWMSPWLTVIAHGVVTFGNTTPTSVGCCLRSEDAGHAGPFKTA